MNIGVYLKCVPDTEENIIISNKVNDIVKNDIKFIINPFDEYAIEEALKFTDTFPETNITIITIGGEYSIECLRKALAMGATSAVLIYREDYSIYDSTADSGEIIKRVIQQNNIDYLLMGKESIDDQKNYLSTVTGVFLDWPYINNVINIEYQDKVIKATRVLSNKQKEILTVKIPCILSVIKGINQPRYPTVMSIMKAANKTIKKVVYQDFLEKSKDDIYIKKLHYYSKKRSNIIIKEENVQLATDKFINYLRKEIKII